MSEILAGTPGLPADQPGTERYSETVPENLPGRPSTNRQEYERVVFLARLVLGFTLVAAATLSVIAITAHQDYVCLVVSVLMVGAAVLYYFKTTRTVKRDFDAAHPDQPE